MKNSITRRQFLKNTALVSSFFFLPRHVLGGKGYTAPSDRINLGFIGAGRHARNLQQRFMDTGETQLVAACDVYKTNLKFFTGRVNAIYATEFGKENYNGCKPYENFRELLALPGIDTVRKRSAPICDAETGHRSATVCTMGNIAYELKRPLKWDPRKEVFKADKAANKMLGRKLRKEWAVQI